jgi:hypothetical protein
MFTCPAARFLWSFVQEAWVCMAGPGPWRVPRNPGEPDWDEAPPLLWFMFAAMSWTLWITHNKMVIEKVFPRRACDSVFKMLASLQLWYPLCRQRDRERVDGMLRALQEAVRHLTMPPD